MKKIGIQNIFLVFRGLLGHTIFYFIKLVTRIFLQYKNITPSPFPIFSELVVQNDQYVGVFFWIFYCLYCN